MGRTILSGMLVALFAFPVSAATISAGHHDLGSGRGPGNEIYIEIIGVGAEVVTGMDLFLFRVDDPPPEVTPGPAFTAITANFPGSLFEGPDVEIPIIPSPDRARVQATVIISRPIPAVPIPVARLTIDTTSVPAAGGTWQLTLDGTVLMGPGGPILTTLVAGSITVGVVPEPAVLAQLLALVGMGGVGLFFRRWKRRAG